MFEAWPRKRYITPMYTTEMGKQPNVKPIGPAEDPALLAAFEARVAADEFIEPKDWMPEAYRKTLTITKGRDAPLILADGSECWVTVHPSFLLRIPEEDRRRS